MPLRTAVKQQVLTSQEMVKKGRLSNPISWEMSLEVENWRAWNYTGLSNPYTYTLSIEKILYKNGLLSWNKNLFPKEE